MWVILQKQEKAKVRSTNRVRCVSAGAAVPRRAVPRRAVPRRLLPGAWALRTSRCRQRWAEGAKRRTGLVVGGGLFPACQTQFQNHFET